MRPSYTLSYTLSYPSITALAASPTGPQIGGVERYEVRIFKVPSFR
jgi:hypothetical protein